MARLKSFAPAPRNRYAELLEREREDARRWPRHDGRLLVDLEAGRPVVVWGFLVDAPSTFARLHPDGTAEPLNDHDPACLAYRKDHDL